MALSVIRLFLTEQGGVIAAWGVNSNGAYVQKLNFSGQLLLGTEWNKA